MTTTQAQSGPAGRPEASLTTAGDITNASLVRRMLGIAWLFRWACLRVILVNACLRVLELSGLGLVTLGIDFIMQSIKLGKEPRWPWGVRPPATWEPFTVVLAIAGAILLISMIRAMLSYASAVAAGDLTNRKIVVYLRQKVYDKLQRLSFRFFDANETGSIINRVTGDVQHVRMFVDGVLIHLVLLAMSLGFYLAYMLNINPRLTLICLATTPVLGVVSVIFSRMVKPAYRRNRKLYDQLITTLSENVQGVHVVKGFALEKAEVGKFARHNQAVRDQQWWIFRVVSYFVPGIGFLTQVNLILLLALGGYTYAQDGISIGGLLAFATLLQRFSDQVASTAQIANSIQQSLIGAQRVFEVLDAPVEIQSPSNPRPMPVGVAGGAVEFQNVSFGYKTGDPVLQDVGFSVRPGQIVAIVGATGSGKSTLMSLLPRFYDPQVGSVRIGGVDVREFDVDELRRSIGIVFQESFLFSNTVAANIAFGHPEATRAQIEKAARIAAAHDFIMELPQQYDTYIGERGSNLSGGQRQRLAIARAVLLEPSILLLDDPTAAIDPQTEHEIMAAMESAMRNRTTFVVAHRLSTLRRADLIIVLDHGRIVQIGTHDQLMAQGGHYQRAARLQIADPESLMLLGMAEEQA